METVVRVRNCVFLPEILPLDRCLSGDAVSLDRVEKAVVEFVLKKYCKKVK